MEKNNTVIKNKKTVKLNHFISIELLKKLKKEAPDTKFILPNGKEAIVYDKK